MNNRKYNWGIVGAGHISRKFVDGIRATTNGCPYAIAARDQRRAQQFADEKNMPIFYGSYEELANDPNVDVVYIGTTNAQHIAHTLLMLAHKKPVLCEKPFALNLHETYQMIDAARSNHTFLMEALWTQFLPAMQALRKIIADGTIGSIQCLKADFGFYREYNRSDRVFSPELGGGSILDIGIYPIFLATTLLGYPDSIAASGIKSQDGIDISASIFFGYKSGVFAQLLSSFSANLGNEAQIFGTKGKITLNKCSFPTRITITTDNETRDYPVETTGNGYNYEAQEVMNCLDNGLIESPVRPLAETLRLVGLMEGVIKQL
jgi:predicted dehydrogenase